MKSILITLFFLLSACSTQQSVVYSSIWKQDYDNAVMIKCRNEAVHFTLLMYEARTEEWSTEGVMRVEHFVFVSCLKHNNQYNLKERKMKNWFKCLFAYKEDQQKKDEEYVVSRKDISEPVLSIVKTFGEKGRWKISNQGSPMMVNLYRSTWGFSVTDTKTGESYDLSSVSYHSCFTGMYPYKYLCFPSELLICTLPSWMTHAEKCYVYEEFQKISKRVGARMQLVDDRRKTKDQKQAKSNQDKERNRLKEVYCK